MALIGSLVLAIVPTSHAYVRPGSTERVSSKINGHPDLSDVAGCSLAQITWGCDGSISDDGRFVAYSSSRSLVSGDVNQVSDVYLFDRRTGSTRLVSSDGRGLAGVGACTYGTEGSGQPSMSGNGRYVAFTSCATNLVANDTNLAEDVFVFDVKSHDMVRASVSSDGNEVENGTITSLPALSPEGDHIAFRSNSAQLVENDNNATFDVFRHTFQSGKTVRVSVASDGTEGNGVVIGSPSLSSNGRFVSFSSKATNLVAGDTNSITDVFVRDIERSETTRVSVASDGSQAMGGHPNVGSETFASGGRAISNDGRYVCFRSTATNLIPADTNLLGGEPGTTSFGVDSFVHDRVAGRTSRVSVTSSGGQVPQDSFGCFISPDGHQVSFSSEGAIVGQDTIGNSDIYAHDTRTGAIEWISTPWKPRAPSASNGPLPGAADPTSLIFSSGGGLSANGRFVAFASEHDDLVENDAGPGWDVFVRDRGPAVGAGGTGVGSNLTARGSERFATTGRIASTDPVNDLPGYADDREADLIGASLNYRPRTDDLFVRLEVQEMRAGLGAPVAVEPTRLFGMTFESSSGRYEIRAQRGASEDFDLAGAASFGLFRCGTAPVCTKVAALRGGYGTTGMEVVFSIPLETIDLQSGGWLSNIEAFSAIGSYAGGSVTTLDTLSLTYQGR